MSCGPKPDGYAALPSGPARAPGSWLLVLPIVVGVLGFAFGGFLVLVVAVLAAQHDNRALTALGVVVVVVVLLVMLVAAGIGLGGARAGTGWFSRRAGIAGGRVRTAGLHSGCAGVGSCCPGAGVGI